MVLLGDADYDILLLPVCLRRVENAQTFLPTQL